MTRRHPAAMFCKWPVPRSAITGPANTPVFQCVERLHFFG